MLPFFGSMAIVIAAATTSSATETTGVVQPAPVTAPIVAAPASRGHRNDQQAISVQRSAASEADKAIRQQQQLRVLAPALTGDGGG